MTSRLRTRRKFLLGAGLSCVSVYAGEHLTAQSRKNSEFAALEAKLGGRLGVSAIDTGTGATLAYRAEERFAMCSTFKLLLAATVLAKVERDGLRLNQLIPYTATDLFDHAPVAKAHLAEGSLPIETLLAAIIEVSDNTAANLLLSLIDGPAGLTSYLRQLGDHTTRLDRIETALNSNLRGDPRDTTTPEAMTHTMQRLLLGNALSAASRSKLLGWMKNSQTGKERLRAGLAAEWIVGDKTGSGANAAVNDVAILWPPQRAPILVAVYMSESTRSLPELNAGHAEIGRIIAMTLV